MTPEERSEARLKRLRLALSVAIMVFGLVMMAAPLTSFGPSPTIGVVFGGALVLYGALRLYQATKD